MGLGTIIALIIALAAAVIIYKVVKSVWAILANGLVGVLVFWLLGFLGIIRVPIDVWTFLIAAIGGLVGVIAVLLLTLLGIPL